VTISDAPVAPSVSALAAQFARARRLCAAGRFDKAERLCRQMLATAPGHPQVTLMLGEILSATGRHQEAIAALTPVIERWPNAGPARFCLGNALHAAGRLPEASAELRRATELQPHFAGAHSNLGLVLDEMGDREGAIHAYERALLIDPDLAEARANLGTALLHAEKFDDAILHLRRAVALRPRLADNHYFLGVALQRRGGAAEAAQCYRTAIGLKPNFAEAHCSLGAALASENNVAEALPCYEAAVAGKPDLLAGWVGLGSAQRALGRFDDAIRSYETALSIDPDSGVAHRALVTCRQAKGEEVDLDRLHRILANAAGDAEERGSAGLAIAKICDDAGRYDEAFAAATEGNALLRVAQRAAGIRYDHEALCVQDDATMRIFSGATLRATTDWGNPSELPVFIVGYFRSGTTLVEQICASHSQVCGVGELRDIRRIVGELQHTTPSPRHWSPQLFRGYADRYLQRLKQLAPGALRVADKMPDNIYLLGQIATMFPRARVILCRRDGRDAALSVFFQRFAREVAFSTDLADAGRRWHETERIAAHWADALPLPVHHVDYETLVADFENEARRLIAFLGLAWEPGCLEFYKTERAVRTASTWQVRQPLYASSAGRWRNYARHLTPLYAAIGLEHDAPTGARPADIADPGRRRDSARGRPEPDCATCR
jgi:tetratricopeptide (TPR) repeat protein